jgi:ribonuclease HI
MITIFTDGSCFAKHAEKLGGIGIYIIYDDNTEEFLSKGYKNTSIARMEMTAILEAMKHIKDKSHLITFYSDSEFIVKSFNQGWLTRWQKEYFTGVKNSDIWLQIIEEKFKFTGQLIFKHTKGHNKNPDSFIAFGNNVADLLCSWEQFKHS